MPILRAGWHSRLFTFSCDIAYSHGLKGRTPLEVVPDADDLRVAELDHDADRLPNGIPTPVCPRCHTSAATWSPASATRSTSAGERDNPSNIRNRALAKALQMADGNLVEHPITHVTSHSLRRTFASLLLASGADVPYVMAQLGHEDPKMTFGVYAKVIASKTDHGAALEDLVGASESALMGTNADRVELDA